VGRSVCIQQRRGRGSLHSFFPKLLLRQTTGRNGAKTPVPWGKRGTKTRYPRSGGPRISEKPPRTEIPASENIPQKKNMAPVQDNRLVLRGGGNGRHQRTHGYVGKRECEGA